MIGRAREVLTLLEGEQLVAGLNGAPSRTSGERSAAAPQLSLFVVEPHPAVERLKRLDANQLTPLDALRVLDELARLAREA